MLSKTSKTAAEAKPVELSHDELAGISGGEMSAKELALFMLQLGAWAKEKSSQPVRLPGL
jgi:hypothetical protein